MKKKNRYQQGGLWNSDKKSFVDSVFNANSSKNFVKRYQNPTAYPVINNPDGSYSTHLMANDNTRVYPTIVQDKSGKLINYGNNDNAWNYTDSTREYINFATPEQAEWFANSKDNTSGYKMGTQKKQKGGKVNPPIYVTDPHDPRLQAYQDSLAIYNKTKDIFDRTQKTGVFTLPTGESTNVKTDNVKVEPYSKYKGDPGFDYRSYNRGTEQEMYPEGIIAYPNTKWYDPRVGGWLVQYKQPAQPVEYQEKTPENQYLINPEEPSFERGKRGELVRKKQQLQATPISDLKQFPVDRQEPEPQPQQIDINSLNPNEEQWMSSQTTPFRPAGFYKKGMFPGQDYVPTRQTGGYSTKGYKANSPDRFNKTNLIPSNRISMSGVEHPIFGVSDSGDKRLMYPGEEHQFNGRRVLEIPIKNNYMAKKQKGLSIPGFQFGGAAIIPDNNPWGTGTKFVPTQYKRTTNGMMQFGGGYLDYTSLDPTVAGMQTGGGVDFIDNRRDSFSKPGYHWTNNGWVKSTGSTMNGASFSKFGGSQNVTGGLPAPLEYAYLQDGGPAPIPTANNLRGQQYGCPDDLNQYQTGGITDQDRALWNRQQGAAYQQGYMGDNHNRAPGQNFMRSQGVDPNKLAAYQQDLAQKSQETPWGNQPAARGSRGFSGADNFYGSKTSGENYTNYQVQHNDEAPRDFGTDWKAATAYNNQRNSSQYAGFGDATKDVNYNPSGYSGFGHSGEAGTPSVSSQPQGLAATGFPTREEAIAKYKSKQSQDDSPSVTMSDYNMHGGESEEMKKGGWIKDAVNPAHKGFCTPMTKSTCTPRRKAFAQTMKKHHGFHKEYGGEINSKHPLSKFMQEGGEYDQGETADTGSTVSTVQDPNVDSTGYTTENQDQGYTQGVEDTGNQEQQDQGFTQETGATQQNSLQEPIFGKRSGAAFSNALGAGMQAASFFLDRKHQREMQGYNRGLGETATAFSGQKMNTSGSKGDYTTQGVFRPNQNTIQRPGITYPQMKNGGSYTADIPHEEIQNLIRKGYKVEMI